MRKILRIQNYLRKKTPIPAVFSEPFKLKNSNKIIIPFKDKLFFHTPIMKLENLLELSNGVYCAEFRINNTLKHTILKRFLMNLDMTIFNKLYNQSTTLFKNSDGRAVQFSKDVIRDNFYPAMRYEDTNNSFYLQLIISDQMYESLKEHEEYYLFVQIENLHFHKKSFLCNLRLDSYQAINDEDEDESDEEEEGDEEGEEEVAELNVQGDGIEQPIATKDDEVDANTSLIHPTTPHESPELHDSQQLKDTEDIPPVDDAPADAPSGIMSVAEPEDGSGADEQSERMESGGSGEAQDDEVVSQFMNMKESLQEKMKELDTMTQEIRAIYSKLKKKQ